LIHPYSDTFDPPAPCLSVYLIHPRRPDATLTLSAQLDTGADITVVPQIAVDRLGLSRVGDALIAGYDDASTLLPLYYFDLNIDDELIRAVKAVAYRGDLVILGRDVLNHFRALLDGPALVFDLTVPEL